MSRGRDDIWGLILLSEAWWTAPCGGGEPPTKVGGLREDILFKSKEYPLALPKKDSRGDFEFPPGTPLKRPKEGLRPFLWKPTRRVRGVSVTKDVGTGDGGGGIVGIRGFSPCGGRGWGRLGSFGAGIGWLLPCEGTGAARRGRRALRVGAGRLHQPPWTGFAAGAAWRPGGWWGPPVGEGSGMGAFVPRPPSSGNSKKGPGPLLGFRRSQRKE